ncbi:MAG: hypothetical protein M1133_11230 [Armatimonadetes bacterium]|nr:hypothetical protein [Armatimonadota bacterium]
MKGRLFIMSVLLVIVAVCGTGYGKPNRNAKAAKPRASASAPVVPRAVVPSAAEPSMPPAIPGAAAASETAAPSAAPSAPAAEGAGPSAPVAAPVAATVGMPSTGVAVDGNYVYVLQEGKLYKFAKADVSACGTAIGPSAACPPGAGPAAASTCTGISYIPGFPSAKTTVTTCTPCPTAPPCPTPSGAGPCPTPSGAGPCPTPPPCPAEPPAPTVTCASCIPAPTTTCPPQSDSACTTTTVSAGPGCGPTACPPIATVSQKTQAAIDCMRSLGGIDVDVAYLQAMIQLNQSVLAVSDAAAIHLGTTSLQNYATNSILDSRSRISQAKGWLNTKYCMYVTTCAPSLDGSALDICKVDRPGKVFDDAYRNQMVQYYIDEIAISQVEVEKGLDSEVKAAAAKTIKENQIRISRLKRCNSCA